MRQARTFVTVGALFVFATLGAAMQPPASGQPGGAQPPGPGQPGERAGRPEGRFGPGGPAPSIEQSMKGLNRAIKQLRGQAGDSSKRDENLRLVNDAQRGLVAAKGQPLPEDFLKNAKDDAAKAALKDTFRKDLIGALRKLVDIEQSIFENKGDDTKKLVEELVKMRDTSHKELGVKDD